MESGVSIAYISDLERANLTNPSLDTLRKIAKALDVTVDYLLGEPGDEPQGPIRELPAALAEFLDGPVFGAALADMSSRWKTDESSLRDEWINVLRNVRVAGREPQNEADWMFLFETVRRAVDD